MLFELPFSSFAFADQLKHYLGWKQICSSIAIFSKAQMEEISKFAYGFRVAIEQT